MPGESIDHACAEGVRIAKQKSVIVEFDFNGINMAATPDTDPAELARSYSKECQLRHERWIASPEYKAQQDEAKRKDDERKAKVADILAAAPEHMTLRDSDSWNKSCAANKDGYGGAVMSYAERWARMMEVRIEGGAKLNDIADECSHLADEEGITGFMYGCAVSILSKVWIHGEALRVWHNLKTQLRNEGVKANESGTVLNPAVIGIS